MPRLDHGSSARPPRSAADDSARGRFKDRLGGSCRKITTTRRRIRSARVEPINTECSRTAAIGTSWDERAPSSFNSCVTAATRARASVAADSSTPRLFACPTNVTRSGGRAANHWPHACSRARLGGRGVTVPRRNSTTTGNGARSLRFGLSRRRAARVDPSALTTFSGRVLRRGPLLRGMGLQSITHHDLTRCGAAVVAAMGQRRCLPTEGDRPFSGSRPSLVVCRTWALGPGSRRMAPRG
jgi:hypothetical protein